MYEASPFPRWFSTTVLEPQTVGAYLRAQLPNYSPSLHLDGPVRALIAGCGTGKQAIDFALRHPSVDVWAIDLSSAYEVKNLSFRHLDLANVALLRIEFDLIERSGVLHHLADPVAGWAALIQVLHPSRRMLRPLRMFG